METAQLAATVAGGPAEMTSDAADVEVTLEKLFPHSSFMGVAPDGVTPVEMVRRASRKRATRVSTMVLQEALERRLNAATDAATAAERLAASSPGSGARASEAATGIDVRREAIYDECVDELVRQIALECPERGVLLRDLRDETLETQSSFDALFEAACHFGCRKSIERDFTKSTHQRLDSLRHEVLALETRVSEMREKREGILKRYSERRQAEDKRHQEEVAFMKKTNLQLTTEIKRLTAAANQSA
jgi:hypothetical protein